MVFTGGPQRSAPRSPGKRLVARLAALLQAVAAPRTRRGLSHDEVEAPFAELVLRLSERIEEEMDSLSR
jgi:hypothetical protein